MTVRYAGHEVDFGGAFQSRFFDKAKGFWVPFPEDLSTAEKAVIHGVDVPVIRKADLIAYKRLLDRDVDREDIAAMTGSFAIDPTVISP
jgi:predicted nucleotidyltransferase